MKFTNSVLLAATTAGLVSAQATYNSTSDSWYCPIANGSYCAGDSLSGNTIILCVNHVGQPGDCGGHAQDRPPIDVYDAPCWQVSPDAGNATCSKNCTVWPDMGLPYSVPGSCNYSMPSPGSDIAGYGLNATSNSTSNSTVTMPTPTPTSSPSPTPNSPKSSSTAKSNAALTLPVNLYTTGSSILGLAVAFGFAL